MKELVSHFLEENRAGNSICAPGLPEECVEQAADQNRGGKSAFPAGAHPRSSHGADRLFLGAAGCGRNRRGG